MIGGLVIERYGHLKWQRVDVIDIKKNEVVKKYRLVKNETVQKTKESSVQTELEIRKRIEARLHKRDEQTLSLEEYEVEKTRRKRADGNNGTKKS